jgi:hypothetical protein
VLGGRTTKLFIVGVDTQGEGRVPCCYLVFISCSALKIDLSVPVFVWFTCRLSLLILYIWHFSIRSRKLRLRTVWDPPC